MKGEIKVNGQTIKLTSKESQILEILIKNKNIVVSKEQLLEKVWAFKQILSLTILKYISHS